MDQRDTPLSRPAPGMPAVICSARPRFANEMSAGQPKRMTARCEFWGLSRGRASGPLRRHPGWPQTCRQSSRPGGWPAGPPVSRAPRCATLGQLSDLPA